MTIRKVLLGGVLVAGALTVAPSAGATNECRGLNPCVPIAGPWVVVPVGRNVPRPQVQFQLTCPRGFIVAGLDAELSDRGIDVAFFGTSGSPVSPGVTTSRSIVFVGSYVGPSPRAPTFRPHAGCVPASGGGGRRTPTGLAAVFPPGQPTVRRVVTAHVSSTKRIVVACRPGERLVAWYTARGFTTQAPPSPELVASLSTAVRATDEQVTAVAHARLGGAVVQVSAVCAGGA
jgi:hypothetical protein